MAESFPNECSATGQTCAMGPHGYDGEIQCEFCGKPAHIQLDQIKHQQLEAASKALGISPEVVAAVDAESAPNYADTAKIAAQSEVKPDALPLQVLPSQKVTGKGVRRLGRKAKTLSKETQRAISEAAEQAKKARANFKQYRKKLEGNLYEYGRLGISIGKPRVVEPISCLASYTDCIEGSANACRETQFMHVPLLCAFYTSRKPGRRAMYLKVGRSTAVLIDNEQDELPDDSLRKGQFSRDTKVFVVPHTQIIATN